jgi:hypothetical protein
VKAEREWEVRRNGVVVCHGSDKTMPDKEQRQKLRKDGHKIYVGGKPYRE